MSIVEKSAPAITTFGIAITKGKVVGEPQWVENTLSTIISGWRHLVGANLAQELSDFASGIARASAHLLVSWIEGSQSQKEKGEGDKGGGFATVMDFLFVMDGIRAQRTAELQRGGLKHKTPNPNKNAG
jgi:hypothetical protein